MKKKTYTFQPEIPPLRRECSLFPATIKIFMLDDFFNQWNNAGFCSAGEVSVQGHFIHHKPHPAGERKTSSGYKKE